MRMRSLMMRKMRILMMISRKMMEKMTKMMRMRKKRYQKESLKVNLNSKTTSPKEIKLSLSVETKDSKEESLSVETNKEDIKATSLTSITITVETEVTSTIEEVKEATEVDTEVESLPSIKVVTGRIIKEESLSTKETDSHSFIATNQFSFSYYIHPSSPWERIFNFLMNFLRMNAL